MSGLRNGNRLAGDYGFIGAMVGLVVSLILFVVLGGLSVWIDRGGRGGRFLSPCLLRMLALLVLTLGLGIGFMAGKSIRG